jgi:hypothetical protein
MTAPPGEFGRDGVTGKDAAPSPIRIGPLAVKADPARVTEFQGATFGDTEAGCVLPFTFPVCWLAAPEIRAGVASLVREDDGAVLLPLHESQSFDYAAPLLADIDYRMSVDIRKEREPLRLVLQAEVGEIVSGADVVHLRMEMVLRIVAITGEDGHAIAERARP